ncbi:MAG: hypothetical protein MR639_00400 [Clostridium sp.]|uniref:hypothetical protein n=1 Tax=Clostridium sp. TaxID=1506 RepID=UPI002A8CD8B6|nr:hypothetical protein [Clostridium sp.]MDY5096805.1 hypothetical protein [Clostridium sp.]
MARELGIINLGAIAPNFVADMVLVDDLNEMKVSTVIYDGNIVAENGELRNEIEDKAFDIES